MLLGKGGLFTHIGRYPGLKNERPRPILDDQRLQGSVRELWFVGIIEVKITLVLGQVTLILKALTDARKGLCC
ncbi:MAG: hypothetical protein ACJAZW_001807 [Maritalea sp.]|jgi:hypothetical protein